VCSLFCLRILVNLAAKRPMHTVEGERTEETTVNREDPPSRADLDLTGSRKRRVSALRDLVIRRAYDVRGEDVAASIIRDALVVSTPSREPRH
jgi:hypothetical protein